MKVPEDSRRSQVTSQFFVTQGKLKACLHSKGLETTRKLTQVGRLTLPGVFTRENINPPLLPCKHKEIQVSAKGNPSQQAINAYVNAGWNCMYGLLLFSSLRSSPSTAVYNTVYMKHCTRQQNNNKNIIIWWTVYFCIPNVYCRLGQLP